VVRQPAAAAAAATVAAAAAAIAPVEPARPRASLWAPLIAAAIAAVLLAFLLLPGVLVFPSQASREEIERNSALLRDDNKGLEEHLRALENAAKQRLCRLPNGQLTPLPTSPGVTLPGGPTSTPPGAPGAPGAPSAPSAPSAPGGQGQTAPNPNLLPPAPERVQIPPAPNAPPGSPTALSDIVDATTVFVYGKSTEPNTIGMGTGFFVTPDHIVTNRHVVSGVVPGTIKVTSKTMGRAQAATVVAISPPGSGLRVQDFAILKVEKPSSTVLKLGPTPPKLSAVVSAGYPGYLTEDDPGFERLIGGDLSAAPESTTQIGVVIQKRENEPVKLVTHSANIGRGNSGGPLLDYCGRVVGVNTWVRNEGKLSTTANLAQDVRELMAFLAANGVAPQVDDAQKQCPPAVAALAPPANAPAPPAAPAAPGAPGAAPAPAAPTPAPTK